MKFLLDFTFLNWKRFLRDSFTLTVGKLSVFADGPCECVFVFFNVHTCQFRCEWCGKSSLESIYLPISTKDAH